LAVISEKLYENRLVELLTYIDCKKNIHKNNSRIKDINNYEISKNSKKKIYKFILKSKNYLRDALKN
jgi:hypothetical protein